MERSNHDARQNAVGLCLRRKFVSQALVQGPQERCAHALVVFVPRTVVDVAARVLDGRWILSRLSSPSTTTSIVCMSFLLGSAMFVEAKSGLVVGSISKSVP